MKQRFNIIKKTPFWLLLWVILAAWALFLFFQNMRYSVQFTGGMELVVDGTIDDEVLTETLTTALEEKQYQDFVINVWEKDGYESILLQIDVGNDEQVSEVTELVQQILLNTHTISSKDQILEMSIIGPSIGDYIRKAAKNAIIGGIILMAIYILFAFSGMRMLISPFLLGIITILTMIFDVSLAAWAYGFLMSINSTIQVDTIFIIALLTVLWYSINDTIVIFDRVRENFLDKQTALEKGTTSYEEIFEMSLWQTMRRSLATSLSTLLVIVAMYVFGTGILRMFAFTLGVWVIAGTYSSIFLAAPFAYLVSNRQKKKKKK